MNSTRTTSGNAGIPGLNRFTPVQLLRVARLFAADAHLPERLDLTATERQWELLESTSSLQVWLLSWPAGASTGWHDHHDASGAFQVVRGTLQEQAWTGRVSLRELSADDGRAFGKTHIHNVSNLQGEPAVSVHVYAPALTHMTRYAVDGQRIRVTGVEKAGVDW